MERGPASPGRRYRHVLVGCGNIGGLYDVRRDGPPFTHAGAFSRRLSRVEPFACVDPSPDRRQIIVEQYGYTYQFDGVPALCESGLAFDIASVCSATETHEDALWRLLETPAALVICEKPFTGSLRAAAPIADAYAARGVHLLVYFPRRWDETVLHMAEQIASGAYGALQKAIGVYGKGVVHNGSHLFHLLGFLLGPLRFVSAGDRLADHRDEDPTVDVMVETAAGAKVHILGTDSRLFDIFEAMLIFEKIVLHIEMSGFSLRVRHIEPNPMFPEHRWVPVGERQPSALDQAMQRMVDHAIATLDEPPDENIGASDALAVLSLCEQAIAGAPAIQKDF